MSDFVKELLFINYALEYSISKNKEEKSFITFCLLSYCRSLILVGNVCKGFFFKPFL